jgi:hypothetical protein
MDASLVAIVLSVFSASVALLGYIAPRTRNTVDDRLYTVVVALLEHVTGKTLSDDKED